VLPSEYQNAIDSGVYLAGVDTSHIGARKVASSEVTGRDSAILLVIGQSNIGNHGAKRFSSSQAVFNFNPFDGQCYEAADPLLGATGDDGSPLCLLGDALIKSAFASSIVFCTLAVGGATVADWAPGGPFHHRLTYALAGLKVAGLWPSHVLWHQGEADALYGTSATNYERTFANLCESLRALAVAAPIFVAGAAFFSIPAGYHDQQREIRKAQEAVLNEQKLIFRGPDTDLILDRCDGCHFGAAGLADHALAWHEVLMQHRRDSRDARLT
jgi:hypothetical protein